MAPRRATIKQPVLASQAVVATNHPLASTAGLQTLAAGGTVADAAVAAAFVLSVVEPMMVGPLGAGYVLLRDGRSGQTLVIDNYGPAPAAASAAMYEPDPAGGPYAAVGHHNRVGYLAAGVPGALKGWCYLHQHHGVLPLADVLAPAIHYAERGFLASEYLVGFLHAEQADLARFPASAAIYLPGGRPPAVGERIVNPDCAATLRAIAAEGPDYLYRGPLGQRLVEAMERHGGLITQQDLAAYDLVVREPVRGTYRGYEVLGVPLSSAGGLLVQEALNILEGFDVQALGFGTAAYWHLVLEVLKILFADRDAYLGDPTVVDAPVDMLIDKAYAARRRAEIDPRRARRFQAGALVSGEGQNTTHITVMDAQGSVVTMTQTLNQMFGARAVIPGTGLLLSDTMALFDPRPDRPNSVAPGKRPLTSTAATIVLRDGQARFAVGTPGASPIFPAVLQCLPNVVDHGMTLQEATEAPRVYADSYVEELEAEVPAEVQEALTALGHTIMVVPRVAGGMNGVRYDPETGLLEGAACWRADGAPAGLSGGAARPGASGTR